jgi:hypothetical protein
MKKPSAESRLFTSFAEAAQPKAKSTAARQTKLETADKRAGIVGHSMSEQQHV